jgi:hypothetical protein
MAILSRQLLVCLAASLCYPLAGAGRENPARDDTFAELKLREADVTIALADVLIRDRRFGRERFTTNLRSFANVIGQPNVTIDARGSRWRFQSYPVPTACYPISIREAGEGLYWWWAGLSSERTRSRWAGWRATCIRMERAATAPHCCWANRRRTESWWMGFAQGKVLEESNNTLIWTGQGEYTGWLSDSFDRTRDISLWQNAPQRWIERHPQLARLPATDRP